VGSSLWGNDRGGGGGAGGGAAAGGGGGPGGGVAGPPAAPPPGGGELFSLVAHCVQRTSTKSIGRNEPFLLLISPAVRALFWQ